MRELWSKAQEAAEDARLLLREGRFDGATSRAYYAMFSTARALLARDGAAAAEAKRHATVWRQFSMRYVEPGHLDKSEGQAIARFSELRKIADYSDRQVTESAAKAMIATMERLIAFAEQELARRSDETDP